jgi:hypothetical protein
LKQVPGPRTATTTGEDARFTILQKEATEDRSEDNQDQGAIFQNCKPLNKITAREKLFGESMRQRSLAYLAQESVEFARNLQTAKSILRIVTNSGNKE